MMDAAARAIESLRLAPLGDPAYDDAPGQDAAPGQDDPSGGGAGLAAARAQDRYRLGSAFGAFVTPMTPAVPGTAVTGSANGPLAGVPVAIKDVFDVAGQWTGNGTSGFGHRAAPRDSVAWARLRAAGAVLVGRTCLPELAWSVTTPGCRNPWSPDREAGGSSGGSAVAVASGAAALALGTDTGGSIRIPAALCGLAGLRPTSGTISRRGVTPLAPTMDTVGPLALTAADCLLVHRVLGGIVRPAPAAAAGLRVGWPANLWQGRVSPDVAAATEAAAVALRAEAVDIVPVDLPLGAAYARAAAYVIILAESAAQWHGVLGEQPGGLSPRTAALLNAGADVPATGYLRALRVARAVRDEAAAAFERHRLSALLLPTVPATAVPLGAASVEIAGRPVPVETAYAGLAALASVTGFPALSVPSGLDPLGLPVGAQLIGPAGQEAALCLLGEVIERSEGGRAVVAAREPICGM
jgi:aspartyl-tRNA(Asn)/glutamyl-tRNA(Gln) amidotransferase subunit A